MSMHAQSACNTRNGERECVCVCLSVCLSVCVYVCERERETCIWVLDATKKWMEQSRVLKKMESRRSTARQLVCNVCVTYMAHSSDGVREMRGQGREAPAAASAMKIRQTRWALAIMNAGTAQLEATLAPRRDVMMVC